MSVTVLYCGAARTATGSCHLFQTGAGRLLVDCGLFQGPKTLKELNYGKFPFTPADIDAVLLTHAYPPSSQANYPAGRHLPDLPLPSGTANKSISARLMAAWRVGEVICAPNRSVT